MLKEGHPLTKSQSIGPPPYGKRAGWRPQNAQDYGDGGAFPEIPVAQYPLDMGRKGSGQSNALAIQVDGEGKVKYDAIVRQGHNDKRIIHASFKDLIPLRQQANMGEISLARPSEEEVAATKRKTQDALAGLVAGAQAAQRPKNVKGLTRAEPTYVRYTPANQMGDTSRKQDRIMKIVERQQDPMEPPKFKHKKIPRGPPSPPPPVLHSPPRKLTAEDQEAWKIPPPISNWKNPKGYAVPLDKRLAADGHGMRDVTINDRFAQFSEALHTADRHAREEVRQRSQMQQRLAEKEKAQKEEHLRMLAQRAREEAQGSRTARRASSQTPPRHTRRQSSYDSRSSRSRSSSYSRSPTPNSEDGRERAAKERERVRRERRAENEKALRQSRMGAERKLQMLAREQNRDISEKVALGLAKPTAAADTMYDARLFNQSSGFDSGFNEDQAYDKPLFAAQELSNAIYRPGRGGAVEEEETGDDQGEVAKFDRAARFDVLGQVGKGQGFKGADVADERSGPVVFERETADPFGIDAMIKEATGEGADAGEKRYGMEENGGRANKRARVDDGH